MECSICLDNIYIKDTSAVLFRNMHILHNSCYTDLIRSGSAIYPLCKVPYLPTSEVLRLKDMIRFAANAGWQFKFCPLRDCHEPEGRLHKEGYCQSMANKLTIKAKELMASSLSKLPFHTLITSIAEHAIRFGVPDLTNYQEINIKYLSKYF